MDILFILVLLSLLSRFESALRSAAGVLTLLVGACLVYSANHDAPDVDTGDVASVALDLVSRAVEALDHVVLGGAKRRARP